MLFDIPDIELVALTSPLLQQQDIRLTVARLDRIHPVVSGNKLFKLHYFLAAYHNGDYRGISTYGGPYSNHLVATAFACRQQNIPCRGFVRGEQPATLSATLQQCQALDMQLEFLSREDYAAVSGQQDPGKHMLMIPEGGYHPLGARGASLIMDAINHQAYSHICLSAGTATTLAGILQKASSGQTVVGVQVLKGINDLDQRLHLLNGRSDYTNLQVEHDYSFGGYAKKTPALLDFMNRLYQDHSLPTDFVYTAKMMYAVFDKISKGDFAPGSHICCLHTGGLQGNRSLPLHSLIF